MFVTEREAAQMYAKTSLKWYGPKAKSVARSMIRNLANKGDVPGIKAWRRVSEEIERLEQRTAAH